MVESSNLQSKYITAYDFDVSQVWAHLHKIFEERIVVLDGGMGTQIQTYRLEEDDYRGEEFKELEKLVKNNNDLLNITKPDLVTEIHEQYLRAGADIIETNTFNGQSISQSDYGLESWAFEINKQASILARRAADKVSTEADKFGETRWRLVAGAVGPTNRTASVSPKVEDPSFRNVTYMELVEAYKEQIAGLIAGGCHIIFIETIFDSLNARAAVFAYMTFFEESGLEKLPLILSGTIIDAAGRTLSGQNTEAFYISMMNAKPFCIGLNCALGATQMYPFLQRLSNIAQCYVHAYPNAGLPNAMGGYDETPENFAVNLRKYATDGLVNMVGGCCGTTPDYIEALYDAVRGVPRRVNIPATQHRTMLSGMQEFIFADHIRFVNVGERCNIAGSLVFKKMIVAGQFDKAVSVAK